ncbi:UNVERIFIED_CONTAM: hypothetical protein Sindi_0048000 [Sesamum indicum]
MDWVQHSVPDDGARSCSIDAGPSSYYYGSGPYDYESGLADHFSNVLYAVDQPLWKCCTLSQLTTIAELVNVKWANKILLPDHTMPRDYYNTKKLIKDLGLPDNVDLEYDKFCGDARYKPTRELDLRCKMFQYAVLRYLPLTPRLQRLYSSRATAEHMMEEGLVCHPSNAEAWKHFDRMYPDFTEEPQNARLGVCTTVLRFTVSMVVLIHIDPLLQLWHVGVRTYNNIMDNAFIMRVALMWIVNDLPAYGMASGWSTAGVMGCLVCMDVTRALHLNKKAFTKNRDEYKVAHSNLKGDQIPDWVVDISHVVEIPLTLPFGYGSDHKWTKKSIFRIFHIGLRI